MSSPPSGPYGPASNGATGGAPGMPGRPQPAAGAEVSPWGAIPPPPKRFDGWRVLWLSLLIAGIALCGIGLLTYIGFRIGPVALGVGIAAAILPVPVLVATFLWLDRYQPSPLLYLALCFLWGAGVATTGALFINTWVSDAFVAAGISSKLEGVLVAPVIEESLKAAFPILLFVFRRRAFTGVIDGVVYAGLSATGFAMVENILYLGGYGFAGGVRQGGLAGGALAVEAMFLGRVVLSGFAHPLFTSMTGFGLGIAARSADRRVRWAAPIIGLLIAMMLHGSWNLMATLAQNDPLVILYGYFAVFMPIFFAAVGAVLWLRSWEGHLTERVLPMYAAAGWFTPPEVAALGTFGRRLSARRWARRVAGDAGQAAMRGYQFAAAQLARLRDGMDRGLRAEPDDMARAVAEEHRLLAIIDAYRRAFTARDPVTPPASWDGRNYRIHLPDGSVREVPAPGLPVVPIPIMLAPGGASPGGYPPPWPPARMVAPPPSWPGAPYR